MQFRLDNYGLVVHPRRKLEDQERTNGSRLYGSSNRLPEIQVAPKESELRETVATNGA